MQINIKEYIEEKGVEIVRDDGDELACLCPFHKNSNSPAFYVNKRTGLWICFNPSCGRKGSMRELMEHFGDKNTFTRDYSVDEILGNLDYKEDVEEHDWSETLDKILIDFSKEPEKASYLLKRGFEPDVLEHFEIGYSANKGRLAIPVRDESFKIIGMIGRATDPTVQPKYLYSKGFPRKRALFNIQNAKRFSEVIVCEGSLDAIKIHQAGFPNVISCLGSMITKEHINGLRTHFDSVVIFADNDHAGHYMRDKLAAGCVDIGLKIVHYKDPEIKDPGDMSEEQIKEAIEDSVDYFDILMSNVV